LIEGRLALLTPHMTQTKVGCSLIQTTYFY